MDNPRRANHTPLHLACAVRNPCETQVLHLLSKGANVNAKGHDAKTPLHLAKTPQIAQILINNGASLDAVTLKEGYTPLHQAIVGKRQDVALVLLERGANVNYTSKNGATALSLAVTKKNNCLVKKIVQCNPDVSIPSNKVCLKTIVKERYLEQSTVQALLDYGFQVNLDDANDTEFILAAARGGYWNVVEQLIKFGGGCPKTNGVVLLYSLGDNARQITDMILSREVDVNAHTNRNWFACETALIAAVRNADVEMSQELIARGAAINIVGFWNFTPLHYACYHLSGVTGLKKVLVDRRAKIAENLINHGANVNALACDESTPLHLAVRYNFLPVVEVLLKSKADVNAQCKLKYTPLHYAVKRANLKVVEILLAYGADINLVNGENETALSFVCVLLKRKKNARLQQSARLLASHTALMTFQHLPVCEAKDQALVEPLLNECRNELAKLKDNKIGDTCLSYFDVLVKNAPSLEKSLGNKAITNILKSNNIKTTFPFYKGFLKKKVNEGLARKNCMDEIRENPLNFFRPLPKICFEKIHDYLSEEDLKKIVEASKIRKT